MTIKQLSEDGSSLPDFREEEVQLHNLELDRRTCVFVADSLGAADGHGKSLVVLSI